MGSNDRSINNYMNLKKHDDGIMLCCRKAKCPVLRIPEEGKVTITDDDGNTVEMDLEQAKLITKAIDQLEEQE